MRSIEKRRFVSRSACWSNRHDSNLLSARSAGRVRASSAKARNRLGERMGLKAAADSGEPQADAEVHHDPSRRRIVGGEDDAGPVREEHAGVGTEGQELAG